MEKHVLQDLTVTDPVEWLRQWVDEGDVARLDAVTVPWSSGDSIGLAGSVTAWRAHVDKIDADLDAAPDDRSVWVSHDLVAAAVIRDRVAEGVQLADPDLRGRIEPAIADVDQWYRRITEPDDDGCLARVDGRPGIGGGWWWHRIPVRGPIRQELASDWGHGR